MKKFLWVLFVIIIIASIVFLSTKEKTEVPAIQTTMKIESSAFLDGEAIPSKYTCDGSNINPSLSFSDIPSNTQSLALLMEDPDVPVSIRSDGMWNHWVVFNIPPETRKIGEGSEPKGIQGITTSNSLGYGGPCPPDREHRYFFKLYALDTILDLSEGATKEEVIKVMEGHILSSAELIGKYERI